MQITKYMKTLAGIIIALTVGAAYAQVKKWEIDKKVTVQKIQDGNVICYIATTGWCIGDPVSISCIH